VRPLRGRLADAVTPEPDAIVIGATLWRTAFDSDEGILGRTVRIDDEPRVVIGVLPSSFRFPARDTSIWFAREVTPVAGDETQVIARLAPGVPTADAFRLATELAHEAEPATSALYARQDELIWVPDTYYERAV